MSKKILLCEKNLYFSVSLSGILKKAGFDVLMAADLTAVKAQPLDSIGAAFVNLGSLGSDGVRIVAQLRKSPATAQIPIVGFAGHKEKELLEDARAAGCTLQVPNSRISSDLPGIMKEIGLL
jgi:CheY-like chemotaxis protein